MSLLSKDSEKYYYICGFEIVRVYANTSVEATVVNEFQTISVSDDEKVFLRMESKINNGQATTVLRYQYDNHLGSACLELSDNGSIISYEEYYPFGQTSYYTSSGSIEVSLKRYKYCGKERDEETGLYYYGMRYYADWLCRFVSVDPLQFEYPELTPFQYASNRPITGTDLDGAEFLDANEARILVRGGGTVELDLDNFNQVTQNLWNQRDLQGGWPAGNTGYPREVMSFSHPDRGCGIYACC